ncbi:MMPL family transporter [Actinomadura hibisca]|uniref:MMPL family transporter n=1 Tax=Actinomadura hibisca TaxID=68565 RepID=UPI0008327491|nr:MMPL family transporter [Actinomadura hibisca]
MTNLPLRAARWSAHHPWRAVLIWVLFVAACLGGGIAAGTNSATAKDFGVGEAGRAEAVAIDAGMQRRPVEQVMIRARSGTLDTAAAQAAAQDVTRRMRELPEVASVAPPVRSPDGRTLMVEVTMKGEELAGRKNVPPLLERTAQVQKAHPGLVVEETGSPSISKGVNDQRGEDLALAEMITLPVTLLTLLLVFGSVVMAGVPVLLALSSIMAAVGLSMVVSHLMPDTGVGTNLILLIGMAVGVDYTLFYLKREQEERARSGGRPAPEALVDAAAATAGRAIVVSGLAVIVSTATLYLATDVIFSSLATGTILVVAVAVASSLTALPALLVKLGHRANRRAARKGVEPKSRKADENGRVWNALLWPARKHPAITLVASVLALLALAAPVLNMKLVEVNRDLFSRDIPAMQSYDRLNAAFPERRAEHRVVVRAEAGRAGEVAAALGELGRRTQNDPMYARNTTPVLKVSPDKRVSVLIVAVPFSISSDQAAASLDRLRSVHIPATIGRTDGAETGVTGDVARSVDYVDHQNAKLPLVVGALLLLTLVMTAIAFRSVVIGLIGMALNVLSAVAALGLLVTVFQGTWAEGALGFESLGAIATRVPLFLFVILFGLSMDYQVFVLSRISEAVRAGVPHREAVLMGIGRSARVVTSAAVVMVTVFASYVFLHLMEMKQMGFSLAVAVLLDAVVIRLMVLPSALLLLGRRSWWPSRPVGEWGSCPPKHTTPSLSGAER